MIQTLEILKGYITCPDAATRNKFFNLLDSFWHKNDGSIIKSHSKDFQGNIVIVLNKKDGSTETINLPALPTSMPISFIETLTDILQEKVTLVPGKGLSTNDLTNELVQKLNLLQNYVHPEFHTIGEIQDLAEIIAGLQPMAPEGFGFSQEDFSPTLKAKLEAYNMRHYGNPVNDLLALAAIPADDYETQQRRYVHSQGCDYFFDGTITAAEALDSDVAPNDQTNTTGYWRKGVNMPDVIDDLTSFSTSKALAANQGRILKGLYDNIMTILGSDDSMLDELQEVVNFIKANREDLQNLSIENIAGLVAALDGKLAKGTYTGTASDLKTLIDNAVKLTGNQSIGGLKTFVDNIQGDKALLLKHGFVAVLAGYLSISAPFADAVGFSNENNLAFNFRMNLLTATRNLTIPNKSGTLALLDDLLALNPKKVTKAISNATQYTAVLEDKDKFLVFTTPIDFIIPSGVFAADDEISFRNKAAGDVTVVAGAGATVQVVSSQSRKVPQFAFAGVRFESGSVSGLYGQLKPI